MKLFTHQSKTFVENLIRDKIIYNNGKLMNDDEHVKYVYKMITKHARENVSEKFTTFPIWCWYTIDSAPLNDGVLIELDVPDELVLLTDYYDWGGSVIPYADDYIYSNKKDKESKAQMLKSFKECINPEMFRDDIQAIIPYIDIDWVTNLEDL